MAIELGSESAAGTPSIKHNMEGASVVFGLVDIEERQSSDFESNNPKWWDNQQVVDMPADQAKARDLQPVMSPVLIGKIIQVDEGDMTLGAGENERAAVMGDEFAIWCEGGVYVQWKEYRKNFIAAHGRRPSVGDVLSYTWESTEAPTKPGRNGLKNRVFAGRPPKPEEQAQTDALEETYHARQAAAAAPAIQLGGNAEGPASGQPVGGTAEVPF